MTAGNNGTGTGPGTGTPENDDPFGYLYRSEGGEGTNQDSAGYQPGVPRTSYNQVRPVGSRTYGGAQGVGAAQRPNPHYAAPETLGRGTPAPGPQPQGGHAAPPARPKRRGLLIAAVAVVVVVAGGIGAAIVANMSGDGKSGQQNSAGGADRDESQKSKKDSDAKKGDDGPKNPSAAGMMQRDAASLRLAGGATTAKDVKGAKADGGTYIAGMNAVGASVEWVLEVPQAGEYTVFVGYGVPGVDANSTLSINGSARSQALNMKNFAQAKNGDWEKGWTRTFAWIDLNKGTNTIKISCEQGNQCNFNLDQVWLKPGHVNG
ncbi:CBM35 domain-containing protein [Streptomyces sp. NPDC049585]|uniref:CBM35 domain-containing protein n=1 Tax=Streptomyces sp. NPDC049585 TaxID=3155154 RepID=UPI00343B016D